MIHEYHMFLSQNRPLRQRARNCRKQRELPHGCLIGMLSVQVVDGAVLSKRAGFPCSTRPTISQMVRRIVFGFSLWGACVLHACGQSALQFAKVSTPEEFQEHVRRGTTHIVGGGGWGGGGAARFSETTQADDSMIAVVFADNGAWTQTIRVCNPQQFSSRRSGVLIECSLDKLPRLTLNLTPVCSW